MPPHLHSEQQFMICQIWIFRCCLAHLYRSIFWGCIYSRENGHQFAKIEPIFQLFSSSHRFEDESLAVKCCSFNLPSCAKVAQFAKGLLEKKRTTETIAYVMLKCSSPLEPTESTQLCAEESQMMLLAHNKPRLGDPFHPEETVHYPTPYKPSKMDIKYCFEKLLLREKKDSVAWQEIREYVMK